MEIRKRRIGQKILVHLSWQTVILVLATLLFVKALSIVSSLILPLLLSAILATALIPLVRWLEKRGLRPGITAFLLLLLFLGICVAIGYLVLPQLYNEFSNLVAQAPELKQKALEKFPADSPFHHLAEQVFQQGKASAGLSTEKMVLAGSLALDGLYKTLLVIIFTAYLAVEGPTNAKWIAAFFRDDIQAKLERTFSEVSKVIGAYVSGQLVTSAISFIFIHVAMHLLGVPSSLLLATLAGVFDILPVLGIVLAVVPAMLFSLHVSPATPLYVLALYLFYHALESYLICPAVYGNRMRLSSFVTLVSLLIGGMLGGVQGAIIVLPIVASYPIIEKIWLRPHLEHDTIAEHAKIEANRKAP